MKNSPVLSIIVPSYNVSKYVDECLPTYIDEYLFGKVIIYCIDDGATDDTKEKIMKYVTKYPHFFVFVHKENGGHGSVINYGVHNLCKTKYFKVIDGDDYVETDSLKILVDYLYKCDDDIVLTGFYRGLPGSMKRIEPFAKKTNIKEKESFGIKSLDCFNVVLHNSTYKTSIFTKNQIRVREKVFYEDNELRAYPLKYAKSFSFLKCYPYCYRFGTSDQSISVSSSIKHYNDDILVMSDLLSFYNSLQRNTLEQKAIARIIASNINFYTEILGSSNNKEMVIKCRKKWKLYKKYKGIKKCVVQSARYKKALIRTNFLLAPLFKKRWKKQ